jgi:tetratricopeptide (TPR) repeat protein
VDPEHADAHLRMAVEVERQHRKGGASALDRRLGRSNGYVKRLLSGRRKLSLATLLEIVAGLRYEPGEFFLWVFGPTHLRADHFLEKLARRATTPAILRRIDPLLARQQASRKGNRPLADEERVGRYWPEIERLNRLSFSDPRQANEETAALLALLVGELEIHGEPLGLLTGSLTLSGRIEYLLGDHPASACYLRRALDHARRCADLAAEAEIYRWCCRLAASRGDHHAALAFADRARDLAVLRHDLAGIGHALTHRGLVLRRLGDVGGAVSHLNVALKYIPADQWSSRSVVFQNLAIIHLCDLDDLGKAKNLCRLAEHENGAKEGLQWWSKAWIRAEIALRESRLDDADAEFGKLREVERARHRHLPAALACMGLAKARMRSGRRGETEAVIREMAELVAGVQAVNRQAGVLMEELVRAARSGKLTAELLDRVSDEMDAAALYLGSTLFSG